MNTLQNNGPHTTARKELGYTHRMVINNFRNDMDRQLAAQPNEIARERLLEDLEHQLQLIRIEQHREMNLLIREQEDEIRETGIDPDAQARVRQIERNRLRMEAARARLQNENRINVGIDARLLERVNQVINARPAPVVGDLARFAQDNQNVHTTTAVQQTKDMVSRILAISVPPEYRWNMRECSKTPGEIIMCCKLTPRGAWQMSAKYCQNEAIYDLGEGIYGKVLDGVWQYILRSPDKTDLCNILKQEMEDNIGMCAQGNLTRLCNILAGYMEGIGPQESPAEILGRKLPLLMEVEDETDRLKQAYDLLVELGIPETQWLSWVEPLVDRTVRLKSTGSGQVIGFELVV